jgi:opacity protein-like surface antigen
MQARSALALALVLVTPGRSAADWFVTPFIGLKFAGDTTLADLDSGASNTKFSLGAVTGWVDASVLGVEAEFGYSPRFFERSSGNLVASSHVITIMGNVVLSVPQAITGDSLRPFISGGAGLMRIGIDDAAGLLPVKSNLFGFNVGGGATGRLTDISSLRFELRYFQSLTDAEEAVREGTSLSFWRAGVGLMLRY